MKSIEKIEKIEDIFKIDLEMNILDFYNILNDNNIIYNDNRWFKLNDNYYIIDKEGSITLIFEIVVKYNNVGWDMEHNIITKNDMLNKLIIPLRNYKINKIRM